jgi:hypothetical protein
VTINSLDPAGCDDPQHRWLVGVVLLREDCLHQNVRLAMLAPQLTQVGVQLPAACTGASLAFQTH